MSDPKPDPGNSGPERWAGEPVDDSEMLEQALHGDSDQEDIEDSDE